MKSIKYILFVFMVLLIGCGEDTIDLSEAQYEPKIVIDGYIYPERKVENIRITRNFPLNQTIDASTIILFNADVKIIDIEENKSYPLTFNIYTASFEYTNNDLIIYYGKKYRIEVRAVVDNKELFAASETTVPQKGLNVINRNLGEMRYRPKDANGTIQKFNLSFQPSSGASIFALSIVALEPSLDNFIFDNAFMDDFDTTQIRENFDQFVHQFTWLQNVEEGTPLINLPLEWYSFWFYTDYKIIVYAGDRNFHHYLVTHQNVQEFDGNFHDPKFYIEGDGIGVFGSAVTDTVYLRVIR